MRDQNVWEYHSSMPGCHFKGQSNSLSRILFQKRTKFWVNLSYKVEHCLPPCLNGMPEMETQVCPECWKKELLWHQVFDNTAILSKFVILCDSYFFPFYQISQWRFSQKSHENRFRDLRLVSVWRNTSLDRFLWNNTQPNHPLHRF